MKSFLEEYGFAILVAIVVILLIAMASPIGDIVKAQITNIINRFSENAMAKLDKAEMENGAKAVLVADDDLTVTATSKTDRFTAVLHWVEGGEKHYGDVKTITHGGEYASTASVFTLNSKDGAPADVTANPDAGSQYYVVVTNTGTGESFESNKLVG